VLIPRIPVAVYGKPHKISVAGGGSRQQITS
jgi:hypothetical protein